jgi:hypothetical protein
MYYPTEFNKMAFEISKLYLVRCEADHSGNGRTAAQEKIFQEIVNNVGKYYVDFICLLNQFVEKIASGFLQKDNLYALVQSYGIEEVDGVCTGNVLETDSCDFGRIKVIKQGCNSKTAGDKCFSTCVCGSNLRCGACPLVKSHCSSECSVETVSGILDVPHKVALEVGANDVCVSKEYVYPSTVAEPYLRILNLLIEIETDLADEFDDGFALIFYDNVHECRFVGCDIEG